MHAPKKIPPLFTPKKAKKVPERVWSLASGVRVKMRLTDRDAMGLAFSATPDARLQTHRRLESETRFCPSGLCCGVSLVTVDAADGWPGSDATQELLRQVDAGDGEAVNRLMERHRRALPDGAVAAGSGFGGAG